MISPAPTSALTVCVSRYECVLQVMPMLIYIGAVMSILYYLGITQVVAGKLGWFVQLTMGTTAIESLGVGANIFLNGVSPHP